jgi:hypothetical protein
LTVETFANAELMNRQRCQERASSMGLLPLHDARTIEDRTMFGPDGYDSRVWVTVDTGQSSETPVFGHAFLVGAFVRKCLFVHYATEVPRASEERLLSARLAVARVRILAGIEMEPFDQPAKVQAEVP